MNTKNHSPVLTIVFFKETCFTLLQEVGDDLGVCILNLLPEVTIPAPFSSQEI